ncbi:hypothetical protein FQN54_004100 [Arachnomyces sp. PD_36]|nr:hypothetical protein FQN54_004100 [Arachnomyces sp. PD_36]
MQYRKYGGGTNDLRLEWNHVPSDTDRARTIAVIRAYINNSRRDADEGGENRSFNQVQPVYATIMAGPHSTTTETRSARSQRAADTEFHISVRFASQAQRNRGEGVSVHIYVNEGTGKYSPTPVEWPSVQPDMGSQKAVYRNRTSWPPGVTAVQAPWAPGETPSQPAATPSSRGLRDAPQPARPAWGASPTTSGGTNASSAATTSHAFTTCPPSCLGVQWNEVTDGTGTYFQGRRRDGSLVRKRGNQYTDENGNAITS